jgi:hypothetical protein
MNTPFWTTEPTILLRAEHISDVYPKPTMSLEEKLNAMSRLVLILTILGYLFSRTIKIILTGIVTLGAIIILYYARKKTIKPDVSKKTIIEKFENPSYYNAMKSQFATPTINNPVMNVLLTDIGDNPRRNEAAPSFNPEVEKAMNTKLKEFISNEMQDPNIDERLFKDLGDNYNFDQSMRSFYSTANTKLPNDQGMFADFCYGNMASCKDGNSMACVRNNSRYTNY